MEWVREGGGRGVGKREENQGINGKERYGRRGVGKIRREGKEWDRGERREGGREREEERGREGGRERGKEGREREEEGEGGKRGERKCPSDLPTQPLTFEPLLISDNGVTSEFPSLVAQNMTTFLQKPAHGIPLTLTHGGVVTGRGVATRGGVVY